MQRAGAREALVVGDRLDTDLAGARTGGFAGLHVLTGVSTARDDVLAPPGLRPHFIAADLGGLLVPHPEPVAAALSDRAGAVSFADAPGSVVNRIVDRGGGAPTLEVPSLTAAEFRRDRGVAPEVCDHLAERKASMIGMDNWGIEPYDFAAVPPAEIESWGYCHANLVTRRGIYIMENMDLKQISDDQAYEFLFAWAPLKLVGATGSPANPIAAY